jgi:hypothetical protein
MADINDEIENLRNRLNEELGISCSSRISRER